MPETTTAKVVVEGTNDVHLPSMNIWGGFDVKTSLDATTPDNRMKILDILDGDVLPFSDCVGNEFMLADYICHPVKLTDKETGEEFDAIRTILIDSDGQCVATCSPYVLQTMGRIGWAKGSMPPWDPPIKVKLAQQTTKDKHRVFKLRAIKG